MGIGPIDILENDIYMDRAFVLFVLGKDWKRTSINRRLDGWIHCRIFLSEITMFYFLSVCGSEKYNEFLAA